MSNDVALSSALRSNLLSLQRTQDQLNTTQERLATGRRVNSALDNPVNFFTSQALNNRASDLNGLLDSISLSIRTIEQTNNAVDNLSSLVDSAESIVGQAESALAAGQNEAKIVGNADLTATDAITDLTGIDEDDSISFTTLDSDGNFTTLTEEISKGDTSAQLVTNINALNDVNNEQLVEAKITEDGELSIRSLNSEDLRIDFDASGGSNNSEVDFVRALGLGDAAQAEFDDSTTGANSTAITLSADPSLESVQLFTDASSNNVAEASDALAGLQNEDSKTIVTGSTDDTFSIAINGEATKVNVDLETASIQELVDAVNTSGLGDDIEASFADGQIQVRAISEDVESVQFSVTSVTSNSSNPSVSLGFGVADTFAATSDGVTGAISAGTVGASTSESVQLGSAASELARLEGEFENVRAQIDELVENDAAFQGTNLLNGDNLQTFFNAERSSSLTTEGVTFTSAGLGLGEADFSRRETVSSFVDNVRSAQTEVRQFGETLANDLSLIQSRQTFTENSVNTLESASDDLTLADQNEEGARLLALQTRQQLATTALSLSAQAQQSVLQLF